MSDKFKDEPYYVKKIAEELRNEIDKEILGKLEDMLKCTEHHVCNCSEIECKKEMEFRINEWDVQEVIEK
jgi:hypothetical protein